MRRSENLWFKCKVCGENKRRNSFHKSNAWVSGYSSTCKKCRSAWRKQNPSYCQMQVRSKRRSQQRAREFLWSYLLEHPCVDCGEKDLLVLTLDHVRQKNFAVSRMICNACSPPTIAKELRQCVVRCFNCHMRRTAKQLRYGKFTKLGEFLRKVRQL